VEAPRSRTGDRLATSCSAIVGASITCSGKTCSSRRGVRDRSPFSSAAKYETTMAIKQQCEVILKAVGLAAGDGGVIEVLHRLGVL
jgi:hypothetical protein